MQDFNLKERKILSRELDTNLKTFSEKSRDKEIQNLLEEIVRETKIFREREKSEFFLKTEENINLISEIDSLIEKKESFILVGSKSSGKSFLIRESLTDREYLYINLSNIERILNLSRRKEESFLSLISKYKLLVLDEYRLERDKNRYFNLIKKIIELRKKEEKVSILISSEDNLKKEDVNFLIDNFLTIDSPNIEFTSKLIREIIKREYLDLKITNSALNFLALILGNNLKEIINKIFKLIFFLKSFEYSNKILELDELIRFFNDLFIVKERKKLINYENNSQLNSLCIRKNFKEEKIKSRLKKRKIVFERDQIIFILKKKLNYSVKDISKILSRSESSINYSIKKIERKMESENFKNYFEYITKI